MTARPWLANKLNCEEEEEEEENDEERRGRRRRKIREKRRKKEVIANIEKLGSRKPWKCYKRNQTTFFCNNELENLLKTLKTSMNELNVIKLSK